jgi:hypothetical protein
MVLIQEANPRSKATREGRSTWIRRVEFSREQVVLLYKKVEWPTQRKEVARLRRGLTFFLDLSTNNMVMETNENMKKLRYAHLLPFRSTK